ncbi:MAG: TauD/TfdA family dioxygenase [Planctomycetaceae bacterium]
MTKSYATQIAIAGQCTYEDSVFPRAFAAEPAITLAQGCDWVAANRELLDKELSRTGTILFRGFPVETADDFDAFVQAFQYPNFAYAKSLSNAVRVNKTERVFTANEAPSDVRIHLHHEMAQTPIYPSRVFFFCEQAAETGGATPLCRSDVLLDRLRIEESDFVAMCEKEGLRYSNVMPANNDASSGMGRSWGSTLSAESKQEAESRLAEMGYSWEWMSDDCLKATTPVLDAVRTLPDGRSTFFNQLIAASQGWKDERNDPSKAITHGDGSALDANAIQTACEIAEELTFDLGWQTGDIALVDNFLVMHARRPFTGTRKVLASLVAS